MGTTLGNIESIIAAFRIEPGAHILDVGCSNIHSLTEVGLVEFVRRFNDIYEVESLRRWAHFVVAGGVMDAAFGGTNGAWLGDVLTRAGFHYTAFDIFPGYKTEYFDLNHQATPDAHRARYDLVLNIGTTEHVLGQLNAFKVIHELAAVGGVVVHEVPMTGYLDHGYFCYNPMLFAHLADANGYDFLELRFSGDDYGETVGRNLVERYAHPSFLKIERRDSGWLSLVLPTSSLFVAFRKTRDSAFRIRLETSTTVGEVPNEIGARYGAEKSDTGSIHPLDHTALLRRLREPGLALEEIMAAYTAHVAVHPNKPFPLTLELKTLDLAVDADPDDEQSKARQHVVRQMIQDLFPLVGELGEANVVFCYQLVFDGIEDHLDAAALTYGEILAAYRQYDSKMSVELFPERLEAEALLTLNEERPSNKAILIRLGTLMARLAPNLPIQTKTGKPTFS
jgi:hypothetical protein